MSVDQIKSNLASLSPAEQNEVAAFLFHMRRAVDPDYQGSVDTRLADRNATHRLTPEEFERRSGQE